MSTQIQIKKATRKTVKLKVAVQGPSGSGKTYGALELAKRLGEKVLVIDTENQSASLYADKFDFDVIDLSAPYTSARYKEAIQAAVSGGYDVLVIDSITHQWDGIGGILRRKEELDQRPGTNSYTNWAKFTPEHTDFIETIKSAPLHIVATMRSKTEYVMETNDKGKQAPRKVGLAPIQRDGTDYEFSIVFDVQLDHRAAVSKDRTGLFNDRIVNLADPKISDELKAWMNSGVAQVVDDPLLVAKATQLMLERGIAEPLRLATIARYEGRIPELITKIEATPVNGNGSTGSPASAPVSDNPPPVQEPVSPVAEEVAEQASPFPVAAEKLNPMTNIDETLLVCKPNDITQETTAKAPYKKYVMVHYSIPRMRENDPEKVRQYDKYYASAWKEQERLWESLLGSRGKECVLRIETKGRYTSILDIISIDGVRFKDGKPETAVA